MSMTIAATVPVADVNELLKTIWRYLCDDNSLHAAPKASRNRLMLWLTFTLSLWKMSCSGCSGAVHDVLVSVLFS